MAERITLLEQETIILYNRAEKAAEVFTYEPSLKRKLAAMEKEYEEVILSEADNGLGGATYIVPKKLINIRKPAKKRPMSEEEKNKLVSRLRGGKEV